MKKITLIGAGAYSLALSRILDKNGVDVTIFTMIADEKELLDRERKNNRILPDAGILEHTAISDNPEDAFSDDCLVIIALPSDVVRPVISSLARYLNGKIICLTTKGVEAETGLLMHDVVNSILEGHKLCAISGPSIALEIANYLPTIVTAAGNHECTSFLKDCFENSKFKVEQTDDLAGTLACGSFKNIYAIGAGILSAKGAGSNALASLITRANIEMSDIVEAVGGRRETMSLSCGIGDLVTTCTSTLSRNRRFGVLVGEEGLADATVNIKSTTVEGYTALIGAMRMVHEHQLSLPVAEAINSIARDNQSPGILLEAICK
jgi:Glycerol-3-phosphate dehydrogenase